MESLISWCADCGQHAVFDAVPDASPAEFLCRGCDAAAIVEYSPSVTAPSLSAVA
ncbi:hypothetical protein [Phytoactinopolyspora mesophila]|uniref:Uncharacterized protein n=1 Tax=Phytoactinopolyspora mesophila TaxID=2650750 RepID=A0A7K3LY88_9ACTN|nr:hypothetical protein [Phytoactinopolyspora mesophila]NDL55642.1 hypothetical protein [Phytoactinopolyspora mesophila]